MRKILKAIGLVLLAALLFAGFQAWRNRDLIQRVMLGGVKVYETVPPELPAKLPRPAILVFSKTNGFRHVEAIPAANALYAQIAKDKGWGYFQTENAAAFSPAILTRFDAVVFNNVSGDVFTPAQRATLKGFIEGGGGWVGIHGAGGDSSYAWRWYVDTLLGAQFVGHPMSPQFQQASVTIEDRTHPATADLPATLSRNDEWYSFAMSPRATPGLHVLATLDEASYSPKGMFWQELHLGKDHPIAWWHCTGKGRTLYTAMGHQPAAYAEPAYRRFLTGAAEWAVAGKDCAAPPAAAKEARP